MGKSQRDKGARFEREIVNSLKEAGFDAQRVPLSGAGHEGKVNGEFAGDIVMPWFDASREKFEAKKRGNGMGFALLYRWMGGHRGLFLGADRKPTLVVLRMEDFLRLCKDKL